MKNPKGVRCTLQDYEVNQVGRRPDGAANGRLDTVGVQYGFKALMAGTITPAQFVELNAAIGGHDINFHRTAARTEADRAGLARALRNRPRQHGEQPRRDRRSSKRACRSPISTSPSTPSWSARGSIARRATTTTTPSGARRPPAKPRWTHRFDVMVAWIKVDQGRHARRPQGAEGDRQQARRWRSDRCIVEGADRPLGACPRPPELARVLAGAPDTNDSGKCQLKPLRRADYGKVAFTEEQWASLQAPSRPACATTASRW